MELSIVCDGVFALVRAESLLLGWLYVLEGQRSTIYEAVITVYAFFIGRTCFVRSLNKGIPVT